ncbi:hypothetical protein KY332_05070 [Candidatus Woesearchaeota archaeon]|nr:hypothetical protein [Candidatus Woesearchaeota archaeon]
MIIDRGLPNKKASLNLSINAIVIVVLAMTLLGLGLGFIKGMFGKLVDLSETTFEKTAENLNRDLTTSTEPLVFSKSRYTMPPRSTSLEGFGIRNDLDVPVSLGIEIELFSCPDKDPTTGKCDQEPTGWYEYFEGPDQYAVPAADTKTAKIQINVPRTAKKGLYLFKIIAYEGIWDGVCAEEDPSCSVFGQTEFFLTVG